MKSKKKVFVAGHNGMVGSAIVKVLKNKKNLELICKDRKELNLISQSAVQNFFKDQKIDQVYLSAAKVGGIHANNTYPAEFIYENIMIQTNIIKSAFENGVKKLLFLGSSCIYPKDSKQPIKEDYLLNGPLELTNEPYAISKIAGIKMCESFNRQYGNTHGTDFRCVMPTNLYGPGDNYHDENSHVIPALIKRFHEAKIHNLPIVKIWGTGDPKREFLYVDDLAHACVHIMDLDKSNYIKRISPRCSHINVGSGEEITIKDLSEIIKTIINYNGKIIFDTIKPDGVSRKLIDSSLLNNLGWKSKISLKDGLYKTYEDFKKCIKH